MNNLLNKFSSVKVENVSRIDEEDKIFCEKTEEIYTETMELYKNILDNSIKLYNKQIVTVDDKYDIFLSKYSYNSFGLDCIKVSVLNLKDSFISKICHYFSQKYNVTISYEKIYEKLKDEELPYGKQENRDKTINENIITYKHLDYNMILDEIFLQLNGFSFFEKAVDEIKQKAKMPLNYYKYRGYWNYEVKGKTIKFRTGISNIKPALYFYDNNELGLIDCYTHNKISDYKSYENGNTDIKFINAEYALEFATKYLGYVVMTEEEREEFKKKCS